MKKHHLIVLVISAGSLVATHLRAQTSTGWTNLFDGKTLKGWKQATGKATYNV